MGINLKMRINMKTATNSLSEFKELLRMNDVAGDPWGVIMGAWFDCAAHLYEVGDCPREWQYRPGLAGNVIDEESAYFEYFNGLNASELLEIGNYLYRISEALKRKGLDY
jgi:hypothetical protein